MIQGKYLNPFTELQERVFARLFEAAEIGKFNRAERAQYEESLKVYRDLKNVIDTAAQEAEVRGITKGVEIGRAEGVEIGRAEGVEIGRAEGELKKTQEIARQLLQQGMSPDLIAGITGLSAEEIEALR
ncbi:MAG: PD-(D/E)XK nuclease family transposase [Acidobacteriota bacterium]